VKYLKTLSVIVIAASVQAQTKENPTWNKVASNDEMTVYVNVASHLRRENVATIWVLEDLTKSAANSSGEIYQSTKKLTSFDCAERIFATKFQIVHEGSMGKGGVVTQDDGVKKSHPVPPGTVVETVFDWACR